MTTDFVHDPEKDIALVRGGVIVQVGRAPDADRAAFGAEPDGDLVDLDPGVAAAGMLWDGATLSPPPPTLGALKAAKQQARQAVYEAKIAAGFPVGELHVAIDGGSRADLSGMALTAALVMQSVPGVTWGSDIVRGWVSIEGPRITLPTPADGIPLATGASAYYAALVQHDQDLDDAIVAAADEAALDGIDLGAGWP